MTTDIATASMSGALAVRGDQPDWTPVQQAAFAHIGIEDAPDADKQVFHYVCQNTGLDPFRRQIYMIKRQDRGEDKWTIQTGIDGFRLIAEEHPQYAGTLDPEWCGPDGVWRETWTEKNPPVMARVKVLRHDRANPISLPVRFNEFAATFKDGNLQGQWRTKPTHMIAKVAEAAALRKAFPRQLAGVYTDDEMANADRQHHNHADAGHDAPPVRTSDLTNRPAAARPLAEHATPVADDVVDAAIHEASCVSGRPCTCGAEPPQPLTKRTSNALFALFGEAGLGGRDEATRAQRIRISELLSGREALTSSADLTEDDGRVIEDSLRAQGDQVSAYVRQLLDEDDAARVEDAAAAEADGGE